MWRNTKIIYHDFYEEPDKELDEGHFVEIKGYEVVEIIPDFPIRAYQTTWDGPKLRLNSGGEHYIWQITQKSKNALHLSMHFGTYILKR